MSRGNQLQLPAQMITVDPNFNIPGLASSEAVTELVDETKSEVTMTMTNPSVSVSKFTNVVEPMLEDVDDGEIIDDDEDPQLIQKNKAAFELRKLKEAEQRKKELSAAMQSSKSKRRTNVIEDDIDLLESLPPGVTSKEIKKSMVELEHQSAAELRERLTCICCFERPR